MVRTLLYLGSHQYWCMGWYRIPRSIWCWESHKGRLRVHYRERDESSNLIDEDRSVQEISLLHQNIKNNNDTERSDDCQTEERSSSLVPWWLVLVAKIGLNHCPLKWVFLATIGLLGMQNHRTIAVFISACFSLSPVVKVGGGGGSVPVFLSSYS